MYVYIYCACTPALFEIRFQLDFLQRCLVKDLLVGNLLCKLFLCFFTERGHSTNIRFPPNLDSLVGEKRFLGAHSSINQFLVQHEKRSATLTFILFEIAFLHELEKKWGQI